MAGRLTSPPLGLPIVSAEPLSGPRAVGASGSQSVSGFVQTTAAPFGLWRWRFSLAPLVGRSFRDYRGWVTELHGGANATRWSFFDPDRMDPAEAGMIVLPDQERLGMPWSNGQPWNVPGRDPWFDTGNWQLSLPVVAVAGSAQRDESVIELADEFWGYRLGRGDYVGFFPFHFGLYEITTVLGSGRYRIWPPLRKAVGPEDFATLDPVLAMRLESEEAATAGRGLSATEGLTITMVEVLDYDARDYFAD